MPSEECGSGVDQLKDALESLRKARSQGLPDDQTHEAVSTAITETIVAHGRLICHRDGLYDDGPERDPDAE